MINPLTEILIERGLSEAHAVEFTCHVLTALDLFEADEAGTAALKKVTFALARFLTAEELSEHLTASVALREHLLGRAPTPTSAKVLACTADDPEWFFDAP